MQLLLKLHQHIYRVTETGQPWRNSRWDDSHRYLSV